MEELDKNQETPQKNADDQEPQVFDAKKDVGGWTFSRRGFLAAAATAATGVAAAAIAASGKTEKVMAQPIQVMDDSALPAGLETGQIFTKTWHVKNNTDEAWGRDAELHLSGVAGVQAPASVSLPDAAPGEVVAISVDLVAPDNLGDVYLEASFAVTKTRYFTYLPIASRVPTATFTPTPTRTPTPTPTNTPEPTVCTCDAVCSCVGHCKCDRVCTCDKVHYWYPN